MLNLKKERDKMDCFLKGAEPRVGVKGLQPEMGLVSTYFGVAMEMNTLSIYFIYHICIKGYITYMDIMTAEKLLSI